MRLSGSVSLLVTLVSAAPALAGWGLEAGVQRDAPSVRDLREFGSHGSPAFFAGAFAAWRPQARWSARLEAAYARRRFSSSAFVTDTPVVADFLEIGLFGAWLPGPRDRAWRFRVELGPEVGVRLRARRRFRDVDQDVADELRSADLKVVLGVWVERAWGSGRLFLSPRFGLGLTDLDATNQQQIRARTAALVVGYER